MLQQINLYRLLPKDRFSLSLEKMAIFYGLFLVIMLLNSSVNFYEKYQKSTELNEINSKLAIEKESLKLLVAQYPILNPNDLETSLKKLQGDLDVKSKMVSVVSQDAGFSEILTAIANAAQPGAWLTEMTFTYREGHMNLKGLATNALAIQEFLENIKKQPGLAHIPFELQSFGKSSASTKPEENYFAFDIVTKAAIK